MGMYVPIRVLWTNKRKYPDNLKYGIFILSIKKKYLRVKHIKYICHVKHNYSTNNILQS